MSESTPIFDPLVLPDGSAAAGQSEGIASVASTQNGDNVINGQDVTMGGQDELFNKSVKPSDGSILNLNNNNNPSGTPTPTAATTMVGRSFVSDAATSGNSRAASADRTGDRVAMPTVAAAHGTPTRQYLNSSVTYHLLDAMKLIAQEQPANPLRVLGEFLLERSKEYEGTTNGTNGEAAGDETKEVDKNGDE